MKYIAVGPSGWGSSDTLEKAVKHCKREIVWIYVKAVNGMRRCTIRIYEASDDAYVDSLGRVVTEYKDGFCKLLEQRTATRRI